MIKVLFHFVFFILVSIVFFGCARAERKESPGVFLMRNVSPRSIKKWEKVNQEVVAAIGENRPQIKEKPTSIPEGILKKQVIVIDAGHGGEDFGTHSKKRPRYQEKSLNLTTALLVRNYLKQLGYETVMTRSKDVFVTVNKRADFANSYGARLFVSVHYNSAPSEEAQGIEVYYYKLDEDKQRVKESHQLAKEVIGKVIDQTHAKSRGVKHGNFAVIRETKMPSILIEAGFMTNESEMEKIKDPTYLKQLAWGIAQGIDAYLKKA